MINSRQQLLVNYLIINKDEYVPESKILSDLAEWYGYIPKEGQTAHDSTSRIWLTKDIRVIKDEGYATVIHSNKGIKLVSTDSCIDYHQRRINEAKRMLKREYRALKAIGAEKQIDIDGMVKEIIDG